jgi:hypothetical protein
MERFAAGFLAARLPRSGMYVAHALTSGRWAEIQRWVSLADVTLAKWSKSSGRKDQESDEQKTV